jgi:FkbM family methyltransferase
MGGSLKDSVRWYVAGTVLERPAKWLWSRMRGSDPNKYDVQTKSIIEKYGERQWNCIDVGAHHGEISDMLLEQCPEGRHFLFEPLPYCASLLARKYEKRKNVAVFNVALSDTDKEAEFNFNVSHPATSGLLQQKYFTRNNQIEKIKVQVRRMDGFFDDSSRIDFMKLDVEGAELLVLKGGDETIRRTRPLIVFEHSIHAAPYYGYGSNEVCSFFEQRGYGTFRLDDFLNDRPALPMPQFVSEVENGREWYFVAKPS